MKNLPRSSKVALAVYAFLPWLLVFALQFVFIPVSWVIALMVVGPVWVFISPLVIYITVFTFANEAVRIERALQEPKHE